MGRKKIVAANWKMNLGLSEGEHLIDQLLSGCPADPDCEVVIAPPFIHLPMLVSKTMGYQISAAAQHCHYEASGAFTGEISVGMLKDVGVTYCITGHSERRQHFHETNEMVKRKINALLAGGLTPIFCCGESITTRESGRQNDFVNNQLGESLFHLDISVFNSVIIAYEPIWAIGTGLTASPDQAQEMHAFIRAAITERYDRLTGEQARILYGGSIKADNALSLFDQPDVDGGLVGGASLQAEGFLRIIEAACG